MRRVATFALIAVSAMSIAQFPVETEASRKPKLQTSGNLLIRNAKILTGTKGTLDKADILIRAGKIAAIGTNLPVPADDYPVYNAAGMVVAPGIVDGHSHRGSDGTNEGADSITAEVRIEDVLNPQAMNVWQALASGHTSAMVLHGSANAVGGQSAVVKYKYRAAPQDMMIPDAPRQIKFALGENVTRKSSTNSTRFPRTRLGVEAVYRRGFNEAKEYIAAWDKYNATKTGKPPRKDLRLETLADILRGKVWVQCHSYRSDEMLMMARLSHEFGFKIGALQHALEAYKIAPELAKAGVGVSMFFDNWSFKQEGYDAIPFNAMICHKAGVNVSINTDGTGGTTALNIDAAKAMRYGGISEEDALKMITINPAKQLGIDHRTGSLEVGKDADIAIWDGHPLSVYSKCQMTIIEGKVYFQRVDAHGIDRVGQRSDNVPKSKYKTEAPLPARANSYAIVGADIYPVSGAVIKGGTIIVRDGKIASVGKNVAIPNGARRVDGRGLRAYPGIIDAFTTIGLQEISPIPVMGDINELGSIQPDLDALTALWVESAHYGPARYVGVTNAYSTNTSGTISGQGAVINTDGYTSEGFGVRRKAGLTISFSGGGRPSFDVCDETVTAADVFGGHVHDHDLTEEQRRQFFDFLGGEPAPVVQGGASTNRAVSDAFDAAKAYATKRKTDPNTAIDLRQEAMLPYVTGEKPVYLRVSNPTSIKSAIEFGQKYNLKVILVGASGAWQVTDEIKKSGYPVIIQPAGETTLSAVTPDNPWDPYDTPYVLPYYLQKAGIKFAFMAGSGSSALGLPFRIGMHCAYGLKHDDAVRAATLSAAEILGVGRELGSIEAGKRGTFILTDGDLFETTTTVRYVFIDGHPSSLSTKHTQLRDKYLYRP